jgi:hypothetical protein
LRVSEESAFFARWRTFLACASGFDVGFPPKTFRIASEHFSSVSLSAHTITGKMQWNPGPTRDWEAKRAKD